MTSSRENIKAFLEELSKRFPNILIKYAYDAEILTHVVELTPIHDYHHNVELDEVWIPFAKKFNRTFRGEGVVFVTAGSDLAIDTNAADLIYNLDVVKHDVSNVETYFYSTLLTQWHDLSFSTNFEFEFDSSKYSAPAELLNATLQSWRNNSYGSNYSSFITQALVLNAPEELYTNTQYAMAA